MPRSCRSTWTDRYEELRRSGSSDAEATDALLADLDAGGLAEELQRVERAVPLEPAVLGAGPRGRVLAGLVHDLRYGLRTLRKNARRTTRAWGS